MVLNMADFGKCRKSLQTPWNAFYMLANGFLTAWWIVRVDFGWIREGPKVADFEQKAWVIAHGFEHGGFWQVPEIVPNSLKRLIHTANGLLTAWGIVRGDFAWILKGPENLPILSKKPGL